MHKFEAKAITALMHTFEAETTTAHMHIFEAVIYAQI
jgi:hypothetical protein